MSALLAALHAALNGSRLLAVLLGTAGFLLLDTPLRAALYALETTVRVGGAGLSGSRDWSSR